MMKTKNLLLTALIAASTLFFASCGGGSMKADAKKMAEFMCETAKIQDEMKEAGTDAEKLAEVQKKMEDKQKEYESVMKEMQEKYEGEEDNAAKRKEMTKFMIEELKNCDSESAKTQVEMLEKSMGAE